jgi:Zn-dependent peptidase ImmA (M78 family)/transcriptional regulator with XRE-family HTH domain
VIAVSVGINIRETRQRLGLSQSDVASAAKMSLNGYRNIELGASQPRVETIAQIARAMRVRIPELLAPKPQLRHVRFRARKALRRRDQILADVGRVLRDYRELERVAEDVLGESDLLRLVGSFAAQEAGDERAVAAAQDARLACGLRDGESIRDLAGLLEDHGVVLILVALHSTFSGLSVGVKDGGPAVVVNETMTVEHRRHTAAHELGHILLHPEAFDVSRNVEEDLEEREADVFASHFLMPREVFGREWEEAKGLPLIDRVLKVKHIFGVSWRSVVYRGYPNDRDIWRRFQSLYLKRSGRTLKKSSEPSPLAEEEFKTDRKDRLLRQALEEERISEGRVAEILSTSIKDVRALRAAWG